MYEWPPSPRLEHRNVRHPSSTSSEVSQHIFIWSPGHYFDFENVKILDKAAHWFGQGVKEATYIRAYQPTLNKDEGWHTTSEFLWPSSDVIDFQGQELHLYQKVHHRFLKLTMCKYPTSVTILIYTFVTRAFPFYIKSFNLEIVKEMDFIYVLDTAVYVVPL